MVFCSTKLTVMYCCWVSCASPSHTPLPVPLLQPVRAAKEHSSGSPRPLQPPESNKPSCYRCGFQHFQKNCPFKEATCFFCGKTGHIAKVCKSKAAKTRNHQPSVNRWMKNKPQLSRIRSPTSWFQLAHTFQHTESSSL